MGRNKLLLEKRRQSQANFYPNNNHGMGGDPKLASQTYLIPEAHNQQAAQFSHQSALASVAFS